MPISINWGCCLWCLHAQRPPLFDDPRGRKEARAPAEQKGGGGDRDRWMMKREAESDKVDVARLNTPCNPKAPSFFNNTYFGP